MTKVQQLDWGSIEWVFEPSPGSSDSMKVGISRMRAGSVQPRHVHSGDEQLVYILSGRGRQKIDDVDYPVEPGRLHHISSGMSHETINDGGEDIVKLLVSIPAAVGGGEAAWENLSESGPEVDTRAFLRRTVGEIRSQMLSPLKLALSIYDADGGLVYENGQYPAFCQRCCGGADVRACCPLYQEKVVYTPPYYVQPSAVVCQYGLSLYARPILCGGTLLGYVRAGHVRTAPPAAETVPEGLPYNVPDSTVAGILQILEKLCRLICDHYRFSQMEAGLEDSQRALGDRQAQNRLLQQSLETSQNQAMNLRLNQHFLFNTLNMIMSMAIREGADQTYQAVTSLASLMQYTLRNDKYFVALREELEYLKNYVKLQQMRFGSRLRVKFDIDESLLAEEVPFHFLQPIAENCFKHGFVDQQEPMELSVRVGKHGGRMIARIADNGCGMDPDRLAYLREIIRSGGGDHGTAMVARNLEALYGGDCRYEVRSGAGGTCVTVEIPRKGGSGHEACPAGR